MASRIFRKTPELSLDDMTRILNNVYAACQVEPAEIPLDTIVSYSNYRQERYSLQKRIAMAAFLLFLVVPLLFIPPRVSVTERSTGGNYASAYHIKVDNSMPVRRINAIIKGTHIPVYEADNHEYIIQPTTNGTATVSVTLINYQNYTVEFEVNSIDNAMPVLTGNKTSKEKVWLFVSDGENGSGINYEGIYGIFADGTQASISSYDEINGEIELAFPDQEMDLYIPDKAGNTLHLLLSFK